MSMKLNILNKNFDIEIISNQNIERAVLSTIIFDPRQYEEIAAQLQPEDFYHPFHQHVFKSMEELFCADLPIDEEFVRERLIKKRVFDEMPFLDILSANPLSNLHAYVKEIRAKAQKRTLLTLAVETKKLIIDDDMTALDIMNVWERKLENILRENDEINKIRHKVKKNKILKKIIDDLQALTLDESIAWDEARKIEKEIKKLKRKIQKPRQKKLADVKKMMRNTLRKEDLENLKEVEILFDFIVKNEISLIAAKPGSGKSLLLLIISCLLLSTYDEIQIVYFDADNSLQTLKNRKLEYVIDKFSERFIYEHASKYDLLTDINILRQVEDLHDVVIVFDSAKNFLHDRLDRDKNKDVSQLMAMYKELRDRGATVILLHHTNKLKNDLNELVYAGSSAWEEDTTNAFMLTKNDYKRTFVFKTFKGRMGVDESDEFAYRIEENDVFFDLVQVDAQWAREDRQYEEIRDEIIGLIENSKSPPMYSNILTHVMDAGFPKNKVNEVIQTGKGRYWKVEKSKQNNKSSFYLLDYEYIQGGDIEVPDKEDESDKSCKRRFESIEYEVDITDRHLDFQSHISVMNSK